MRRSPDRVRYRKATHTQMPRYCVLLLVSSCLDQSRDDPFRPWLGLGCGLMLCAFLPACRHPKKHTVDSNRPDHFPPSRDAETSISPSAHQPWTTLKLHLLFFPLFVIFKKARQEAKQTRVNMWIINWCMFLACPSSSLPLFRAHAYRSAVDKVKSRME